MTYGDPVSGIWLGRLPSDNQFPWANEEYAEPDRIESVSLRVVAGAAQTLISGAVSGESILVHELRFTQPIGVFFGGPTRATFNRVPSSGSAITVEVVTLEDFAAGPGQPLASHTAEKKGADNRNPLFTLEASESLTVRHDQDGTYDCTARFSRHK